MEQAKQGEMITREERILAKCLRMQRRRPATPTTRRHIKSHTRKLIFARDGHKCLKCNSGENLTIDHIVPVSMGGVKRKFNLQTLCEKCNNQKGDMIICYVKTIPQ